MRYIKKEYEAIQNGDMSAFTLIYKKFRPVLRKFIRRFIYNEKNVEDLIQDIFTDFWRQRQKIIGNTNNIEAWLTQHAKNIMCTHVKAVKRLQATKDGYIPYVRAKYTKPPYDNEHDDAANTHTRIMAQQTAILQWAKQLSAENRQIIQLIFEGLTLASIAKHTNADAKNINRRVRSIISQITQIRDAKITATVRLLLQVLPNFAELSDSEMLLMISQVDEAICNLPKESKTVIKLYLTEKTYADMARKLKCSEYLAIQSFKKAIQELQAMVMADLKTI